MNAKFTNIYHLTFIEENEVNIVNAIKLFHFFRKVLARIKPCLSKLTAQVKANICKLHMKHHLLINWIHCNQKRSFTSIITQSPHPTKRTGKDCTPSTNIRIVAPAHMRHSYIAVLNIHFTVHTLVQLYLHDIGTLSSVTS